MTELNARHPLVSINRASFWPVCTVKPRVPETVIFYCLWDNFDRNGNYFTISAVCVQFVLGANPNFPRKGNFISVSGVRGFTV